MSLVSDILDRQQDKVLEGMQRLMLAQQRDIAELKGSLKALIAVLTSGSSRAHNEEGGRGPLF